MKIKNSFTLIAILTSLLLPALGTARETAKKISCTNNMKQIGNGFAMYISDYDYLPPARLIGLQNKLPMRFKII